MSAYIVIDRLPEFLPPFKHLTMPKPKTKFEIEANRSYTLKEFTAILKKQAKEANVKGLNRRPETEIMLAMKLRVMKAALETDKKQIEGFRGTFRKDVEATVNVIKKNLIALDLKEEPTKMSKEERAAQLAAGKDRPVFWM